MAKETCRIHWLVMVCVFVFAHSATAGTIHVKLDGSGNFDNIQAAVNTAGEGDVVVIYPGTYKGSGNRDIELPNKSITIRSSDPNDPNIVAATIIDCNGTEAEHHRGFTVIGPMSEYITIRGLTITGGYASEGGAIYGNFVQLSIGNCVITGNCAVTNGGGIYTQEEAILEIKDSIIKENTAGGDGGGIYMMYPWNSLNANGCEFSMNNAAGAGGGLYTGIWQTSLADCSIIENSAKFGGGLYNENYGLKTSNIIFEKNHATESGGGLYNVSTNVEGCVFIENSADSSGGGIYNSNWGQDLHTISDCNFITNNSDQGSGIYNEEETELKIIECTFEGNEGSSIHNNANGICSVSNCLFSKNNRVIENYSSSLDVGQCVFVDNAECIINYYNAVIRQCFFERNSSAIIFVYSSKAVADIENCIFHKNSGIAIDCSRSETVTLKGCIFSGNAEKAVNSTDLLAKSIISITGCTFTGNFTSNGLINTSSKTKQLSISNSIFWNNIPNTIGDISAEKILITYNNIAGGWPIGGNIDMDPCFVDPGYWDPNGTSEDGSDDFWVDGDYHLKSQAGRWDSNSQTWVKDDVTSPCIDVGDPASPIGQEPFPNGGIINMGAYAGTAQASKSWFNKPVCETIVAGDLNGDCKVDWADFVILSRHWLGNAGQ